MAFVAGEPKRARELLGRRHAPAPEEEDYVNLAQVHAALGDREEALRLLAKAVERGDTAYRWARQDPFFASLEGDARYEGLVEKIWAFR